MANCAHNEDGICKSCRQTLAEGGTVPLTQPVPPRSPLIEKAVQKEQDRKR